MAVGQIDWLLRKAIDGCLFILKDNETKIRDTLLTIVWEVLGLGHTLGVDADIDHLKENYPDLVFGGRQVEFITFPNLLNKASRLLS